MKRIDFTLQFLCKRKPIENMEQSEYAFKLMDMQDVLGDEAVESLAGFYIYAIDHIKGEKGGNAIEETFIHDLMGYKHKGFLPRSNGYLKFWEEECSKYTFTNN